MKANSYHELNPLIRLKEQELLPVEMLERLLQAANVQEMARLLQTSIYGEFVAEDQTTDLERQLLVHHQHLVKELLESAPEPAVVWLHTMRDTFHNLKAVTKSELLGKKADHLYVADGFYSLEQLQRAVQTGVTSDLPAELLESIQEVKAYFEESNQLQGIDVIFDRHYLRCQRQLVETLQEPVLLEGIIQRIDFTNVLMTARGIQQGRSRRFMSTVLSSHGRISKAELLEMVEEPLAHFGEWLLTTTYAEMLRPSIKESVLDFVQLARIGEDAFTKQLASAQIQAFGPLPLAALLNAKAMERKNLHLLFVGKRANIPESQLRERMRLTG